MMNSHWDLPFYTHRKRCQLLQNRSDEKDKEKDFLNSEEILLHKESLLIANYWTALYSCDKLCATVVWIVS